MEETKKVMIESYSLIVQISTVRLEIKRDIVKISDKGLFHLSHIVIKAR